MELQPVTDSLVEMCQETFKADGFIGAGCWHRLYLPTEDHVIKDQKLWMACWPQCMHFQGGNAIFATGNKQLGKSKKLLYGNAVIILFYHHCFSPIFHSRHWSQVVKMQTNHPLACSCLGQWFSNSLPSGNLFHVALPNEEFFVFFSVWHRTWIVSVPQMTLFLQFLFYLDIQAGKVHLGPFLDHHWVPPLCHAIVHCCNSPPPFLDSYSGTW